MRGAAGETVRNLVKVSARVSDDLLTSSTCMDIKGARTCLEQPLPSYFQGLLYAILPFLGSYSCIVASLYLQFFFRHSLVAPGSNRFHAKRIGNS